MSDERDESGDETGIGESGEATVGDGPAGTTVGEEAPTRTEGGTGLEPNLAGAVSYLLGPITGIVLYALEDDDFVRFHAAQSTIVFGGLFVIGTVFFVLTTILALIPVVGWLVALVVGFLPLLLTPVAFVAWLFLMYNAYTGGEYEVPWAGRYARRYVTSGGAVGAQADVDDV